MRGVNHSLEISGNPYTKSEISYAESRNPFEKSEILYAKCASDLPLGEMCPEDEKSKFETSEQNCTH